MITLITANWLFYLIALLIGVVTAFWVWAASGRESSAADRFEAGDGLLEKAGEPLRPTEPQPEPAQSEPVPSNPILSEPAQPVLDVPKPAKPPARPAKPAPTPKPAVTPTKQAEAPPPPSGKPDIPAAVGEPDNLRLIKGVGPKLNTLLNNLGVTRFDQIAEWKEAEIVEVDRYLDTFSGRITRDAWIDQAKFLAKDDIAGFEKKYGKL